MDILLDIDIDVDEGIDIERFKRFRHSRNCPERDTTEDRSSRFNASVTTFQASFLALLVFTLPELLDNTSLCSSVSIRKMSRSSGVKVSRVIA